jgi:hypothetical protein
VRHGERLGLELHDFGGAVRRIEEDDSYDVVVVTGFVE